MAELSAYDQHMLGRIDQEAAALARADEAIAASALGAILEIVRRAGPAVFAHALVALRQPAAQHTMPTMRAQIAAALARLERMPKSALPKAPPEPAAKPLAPRPTTLTVTSMQPGARYRVVQDFKDFDGTPFRAGTVLTFEGYSYFPYDGGYTISFREGGLRLAEIDAANRPVLENHGNAFFTPADDAEPA